MAKKPIYLIHGNQGNSNGRRRAGQREQVDARRTRKATQGRFRCHLPSQVDFSWEAAIGSCAVFSSSGQAESNCRHKGWELCLFFAWVSAPWQSPHLAKKTELHTWQFPEGGKMFAGAENWNDTGTGVSPGRFRADSENIHPASKMW